MAASLMHRGQERHERIGLRAATFLKRCGRDPETGQLLTLSGKRVEDEMSPEHKAALHVHARRHKRQHLWTPRLPDELLTTNGTRDAADWHDMLLDDDATIVRQDAEDAMSASRQRAGTAHITSLHPAEFYLPPKHRAIDATATAAAARSSRAAADDPNALASSARVSDWSASPAAGFHAGSPQQQVSDAEFIEALKMTEVFLSKDTTRHRSLRHLRADNKIGRVSMSQIIRGDGLDKVTSGIPPDSRKVVRPGRVELLIAGETEQNPQRVVSRLISQKQLVKEKLCHSVAMVAKYPQ
jgi:hypothetical protein